MCGLKEFLKVQGTFLKKFLQIPHFPIGKKLNLVRFIKTLLKGFTPHLLRFAQHLLPEEKALKPFRQATLATFPFRDGLLLAILQLT